jgi:hypothetical protein
MGGSITAALFLKEFIKEGVEWAHMDIAGPVRGGVGVGWGESDEGGCGLCPTPCAPHAPETQPNPTQPHPSQPGLEREGGPSHRLRRRDPGRVGDRERQVMGEKTEEAAAADRAKR